MYKNAFSKLRHRIAAVSATIRPATYVTPLLAALLVASIVGAYFVQRLQYRHAQQRNDVQHQAESHAHMLERRLERNLSAPALLAVLLQNAGHDGDKFDALVKQVIKLQDGVSSLQISPDGVPWKTYNSKSEVVLGLGTPPGATAVGTELVALGTLSLTANQQGLVASQPIYAQHLGAEPQFWGYVSAVIGVPDLIATAHLDELFAEGYSYQLSYRASGASGARILIDANHIGDERTIPYVIALVNGDTLVLSVAPRSGWSLWPDMVVDFSLTVLASLLLGSLIFFMLRRPEELEREVLARTSALADAKTSLEREMAVRAQAEQAAQRSHALLDSVFEHMPNMILVKSVSDLRMLRVNRYCEQLLGCDRAALVGQRLEDLFPPAQAARLSAADREAIQTGKLVDIAEEYFDMPGRGPHWLHLRKLTLTDQHGKPEYLLVLGEDITQRKALTRQLEEHSHFLEQLLDAIPSPVFYKNAEGRYLGINRAFERFFGDTREHLIGLSAFDVAPKALAEVYQRADDALFASRGTQTYESAVQCADGKRRDVIFNKAVFHDTNGELGGLVGVVLDITERIAAERRITQLNRTFAVISETNQAIVRIRDRSKLMERACEILVEKGGFPVTWIGLDIPGAARKLMVIKGAPQALVERAAELAEAGEMHPCQPPGCSPDCAIPRFCNSLVGCDQELIRMGKTHGLAALAVLPLTLENRVIGKLGIFGEEENLFNEAERELLCDLAADLSFALEAIEQDERRRQAESSLRLAAHVFANSSEGVMITDADNRILMVNQAFTTMTGYTQDEVLGKKPDLLNSGQQSPAFYREMWQALRSRGEWHGEILNRRKNGEIYSEWLTLGVARDESGELTNYVAVFADITTRKQAEQRLNFLTNYDVLTSLPNRVLFGDRIEQCVSRARADNRPVGLLLLDLDRFKLINDTFGHSAGDRVLRGIAGRLRLNINEGDSVSRLGGDQFAIILPTIAGADEAAAMAARLLGALEAPMDYDGLELYTAGSIGISLFPEDGAEPEALIKNAESAMYQAMEAGGNTYRFYHQQMNARSSERMTLETKLRHAMERGELQVCYQPFVEAQSGRIVGAEALLRWHRPDEGFIAPDRFIPLLEESGLIVPVGEWALRTACLDNQVWRQTGGPQLCVAVNVSALQLTGDGFVRRIRRLIEEIGLDDACLEIELTESSLMRDPELGLATLHQLKELGVKLSVDDFGTGYSSLSYLQRFPIDALKIDRSFVQGLPHDSGAIAHAIIAMAHSLNLKVVAEGTESAAQVDFLRRARCDLLQGYYFAPAVTQSEFLGLIRAQPYVDSMTGAAPQASLA